MRNDIEDVLNRSDHSTENSELAKELTTILEEKYNFLYTCILVYNSTKKSIFGTLKNSRSVMNYFFDGVISVSVLHHNNGKCVVVFCRNTDKGIKYEKNENDQFAMIADQTSSLTRIFKLFDREIHQYPDELDRHAARQCVCTKELLKTEMKHEVADDYWGLVCITPYAALAVEVNYPGVYYLSKRDCFEYFMVRC